MTNCFKCGKEIDTKETKAYDEDNNKECLKCHFSYMNDKDVTIIALVNEE